MKSILFDFDGTIASTTLYHQKGWADTLAFLKIEKELSELLPYEKDLLERFDSYDRLKRGFLPSDKEVQYIAEMLNVNDRDIDTLAKKIMDIKESFTISAIRTEDISDSMNRLKDGVIEVIEEAKKHNLGIGVLSSSRKGIVFSYLKKVNIADYFDYLVCEEDLYKEGKLYDKPDGFAVSLIGEKKYAYPMAYIGDSYVDQMFAEKAGLEYFSIENIYDVRKLFV